MKWSDRWEIRTWTPSCADNAPRVTGLTGLLERLGLDTSKPTAETWYVQEVLRTVQDGFKARRVEAWFDGQVLLAVGTLEEVDAKS